MLSSTLVLAVLPETGFAATCEVQNFRNAIQTENLRPYLTIRVGDSIRGGHNPLADSVRGKAHSTGTLSAASPEAFPVSFSGSCFLLVQTTNAAQRQIFTCEAAKCKWACYFKTSPFNTLLILLK